MQQTRSPTAFVLIKCPLWSERRIRRGPCPRPPESPYERSRSGPRSRSDHKEQAENLWRDQNFWPDIIELATGAVLRRRGFSAEFERRWGKLTPARAGGRTPADRGGWRERVRSSWLWRVSRKRCSANSGTDVGRRWPRSSTTRAGPTCVSDRSCRGASRRDRRGKAEASPRRGRAGWRSARADSRPSKRAAHTEGGCWGGRNPGSVGHRGFRIHLYG